MLRWRTHSGVGLAVALVALLGAGPVLASGGNHPKLDQKLNERAKAAGKSRVIISMVPGWDASAEVKKSGGKLGRRLPSVGGLVAELSNGQLRRLADHPGVASIHWDRPTGGEMNRAAVAVGARAVQQGLGYDGSGVGVAVIDSGITSWHDDLSYPGASLLVKMASGQRVVKFVDFVNGRNSTYDDNGHGSHVAGIVAGNGMDSRGAHAGIAPGAHLVGLKVLDAVGRGVISDVIAALEFTVANRTAYNIRVINLSVGAAVTESYRTDPLTLAAKHAVDAGIVVVTAAGNLGTSAAGNPQYGGITAPGNAPWVLTVGAYSHEGTVRRTDDLMATYSSRGPTAIDFAAKPDLVAPGTGIVSLSDPSSTFYTSKAAYLLNGSLSVGYKPYLSLSGTSMAAPVVSGSVALMMQANPALTPNLVKAILQYTAQNYEQYDALTQGAGFINAKGAVDLARFFSSASEGDRYPSTHRWSRTLHWGNRRITGGAIKPTANAWSPEVVWGSAFDPDGDNIVWGTLCGDDCDNLVWGTLAFESSFAWGRASDDADNIVWGTYLAGGSLLWGRLFDDGDNIVWGTDCGGDDCTGVVWGSAMRYVTDDADNIVWGTALSSFYIIWGDDGDFDNIVWGTSSEADNATWGNSGTETPLFDNPDAEPVTFDSSVYEDLFATVTLTTTLEGGGF